MDNVYIVTYWEKIQEEPTVIAWGNKNAAASYLDYCKKRYGNAVLDEYPIYNKFCRKLK